MSEKNGTTAELLRKLERGIEEVRDSERFRAYLDTCAKFHQYSLGNQMLIWMQRPNASRVAGFHTWLGMDRHVCKGEKGIKILAPVTYKRQGEDEDDEPETVTTFRTVHVFDVSQTDGKPLPEIARPPAGDDGALYDKLAAIAIAESLTIEREPKNTTANGYYTGRTIWISPELAPTMAAKTMAHELAHHFAGHTGSCMQSRNVAETIVESVAYVVLGHFGIDSSQYSFDYVATWSQDAKVFKSELATISRVAKVIIERLGKEPEIVPPEPAPVVVAAVAPIEEPSSVTAPAVAYGDTARPRLVVAKRGKKISGSGRSSRYQFIYEPYAGKGKPIPAQLTDHEYAGVTFVRILAASLSRGKPANRYVSWPMSRGERAQAQANETVRRRNLEREYKRAA